MKKEDWINAEKVRICSNISMVKAKNNPKKRVFTEEIKKFWTLTNMIVLSFFLVLISFSLMFVVSVILQLCGLVKVVL